MALAQQQQQRWWSLHNGLSLPLCGGGYRSATAATTASTGRRPGTACMSRPVFARRLPPRAWSLQRPRALAALRHVRAQSQASNDTAEKPPATIGFKHVLLPIMDQNPYLSESTRQATAMTTALAKKYGADITVVVIEQGLREKQDAQEAKDKHELQLKTLHWHLSEVKEASGIKQHQQNGSREPAFAGGFENYTLVEKLGEEQLPAAVIGELADDLGLDLVVMDTAAIHQKQIDANLLVEFVPCPVLMLPL